MHHSSQQGESADETEARKYERALLGRCVEGDLAAFDELVAMHRTRVFSMLVSIVRNEEDAWDIAQDGFVKAWRSLRTFKGDSTFFTWLFRIMRNLAIDHLRKRERRAETAWDDARAGTETNGITSARHPASTPDQLAWQAEIGRRIDEALGQLSDDHREVVVLRELHGFSYEEIASVTGCSTGTVMSRLFYARKNLQQLLGDIYSQL